MLPAAPAELPPITGPQQYQVQFTTSEEHVKLVERAKTLLARERPGLALGDLHLEAMRLLVATLEKRKFAVTNRPRKPARLSRPVEEAAQSADSSAQEPARQPRQSALTPRQRGRYVPAPERRAVFERDGGRCTYIDSNGGRCRETHYLELHHLQPFAQGGANLASNLTLRCTAHNALAAEEDFGRELIEQRHGHARQESLAAQCDPRDFDVAHPWPHVPNSSPRGAWSLSTSPSTGSMHVTGGSRGLGSCRPLACLLAGGVREAPSSVICDRVRAWHGTPQHQ